ncbi:cell wall-active antibiotics response protein [Streptomyces tubercidicus]|uniref:Cell wall-active antibiotics response LiaF-like C-terminal domain-containing protein n=1 Tax=Streptomyces tubercidicus TaxID=47759 RepID=A0A640UJY6_9ACTN|nr:cell wall-active antibiotics response protein [Streptomyces tubercidicus]WAU10701.1 cell wall-active antibiotics response protein [Streptomyces tubercidicus]GFE35850.1 hypothetical protein Stube_05230 [Streptomyces tubercidicus]
MAVLSWPSPGVQDLPEADAIAVAREANDQLAEIAASWPGRFKGSQRLPPSHRPRLRPTWSAGARAGLPRSRAVRTKTYGELGALVADLPQERPSDSRSGTDAETLVLKPRLGSIEQSGRWTVPRRIVAECKMLHIVIDFTEATCAHRDVTVEASCGTGNIQLIVPQGWAVRIDGASTNTVHISNRATAP